MGLRDWRTKHSMKDPVRGEFLVTGEYFAHAHSNSARQMLTGVITAPGVTATAGEHLSDLAGHWVGNDVLPALVDRADPTKFTILWDEVTKKDFRAEARARAAQAASEANPNISLRKPVDPDPQATARNAADGAVPPWATEMIADLASRGLLPTTPGQQTSANPIVVNLPPQILDLTAGHLSGADAARLISTGEPATAVLTAVADVAVPPQALPGPTASLCDLTLRVTRRDGRTYTAYSRLGFRDAGRRALIAVIGSTLPVRVDPADPNRVAVDADVFNAQHPTSDT